MERGNYLIWSYMRCFDHDKSDFGISEYLEKVGRVPDGFCALVVHPDFVHLHAGMEEQQMIPPQMFGFRGDPRRLSPEKKAAYTWTNHQIKGLVEEIHRQGMKIYISLMGLYYLDIFHEEWMGQHQEVLMQCTERVEELVALKRLKDGTYYEDFFIGQLLRTLQDYGMDGVHLCDRFSPLSEPLADADYSTDMVEQFVAYTDVEMPEHVRAGMGDDCTENKKARQRWIWKEERAKWIRFYDWRWTEFYKKVCSAVHAVGGKVATLGGYVSDPLRSMYSMGTDARHLTQAGVDFFTANILPTSVNMNGMEGEFEFLFHRYMTIIPAMKGLAPDAHIYQMLGVRDEEEEWDVFRHAPNQFERDVYTSMSYQLVRADGIRRCIDKPFITIGDSIGEEEWKVLNTYFDMIYSLNPARVISPVLYWSDEANDRMLEAHIATRRPSASQLQTYLQEQGAYCGGVVRGEELAAHEGTLFVPTFDLLSRMEQEALIQSGRPVLAMAPLDYDISGMGVSVRFADPFSKYPQQVFLLNAPAPADLTPYESMISEDDGTSDLPPEEELHDEKLNVMYEMYSQKVSKGFRMLCAQLFRYMDGLYNPFSCNEGIMVHQDVDGSYRVLVYNSSEDRYGKAMVTAGKEVKQIETLSSYPYYPVKFVDDLTNTSETRVLAGRLDNASGLTFQSKLRPGGVSVFKIMLGGE